MSFSASDQRVYVTNVRIPVFDQNTEATRVILSDVHDTSGHAIRTTVSNNVITSPLVKSTDYDVVKNADLYADSLGDNTPPFIASPRGIPGWSYLNTNAAKASNVYYYLNVPAISTSVQSNISLTNLDYFYAVIVLEHIGENVANLPFLVVGSQATGSGDSNPGFANTRYTYTIPTATHKLVLGEPILIYFSANSANKPPESFMPNLRRIKCSLFSTLGPGTGTKLGYLSINTQTATTRSQYILQSAGYKFSAAGGEQGNVTGVAVVNSNFVVDSVQPVSVSGIVSVTGTVSTNISGQTVNVGNFPATQGVTGSVSVSNFPAVQTVSVSGAVSVTGAVSTDISGQTVNVGNFPTTQGVTGSVSVSNFPAVQTVSVSGIVDVSGSFTANISGQTVNVGNFPAVQTVSVSGPVSVTGTVATNISGQSIVVSNFPATQGVTGSVSVSNFPAIQTVSVSGIVDVSGSFTANISGQTVNIGNTVGVTGTVALATSTVVGITGPISISGVVFDATRLTVYDASLNSRFSNLSYTGTLLNVYDSTTETKLTATNSLLTTIEADISGGVISKGVDDEGIAYPMYTDANGVQRMQVVSGHIETAKYVFETDASVIASSSGAGWSIDSRGRPGWYYDAIAVTTLDWYANSISAPVSIEFNKVQSIYMVATMDSLTLLPVMKVITSASVWEFSLPSASIYNGESYLFYYGAKAINLHPENHPLLMTRTLISGPGANNETVTDIQVLSRSSGTNGSKFLIEKAGIWNQDLLQRFDVTFGNTRAFKAETNLGSLTYTGTKLQTIDASANATLTTLNNTLTLINNRQVVNPTGIRGNVANSVTIAGWADSASFSLGFIYGIDTVFCYEDTATAATGDIAILGSTDNSTFQLFGLLTPVQRYNASGASVGRWATTRLNVAPFNYMKLRNVDSVSLTGVVASIFSGKGTSVA